MTPVCAAEGVIAQVPSARVSSTAACEAETSVGWGGRHTVSGAGNIDDCRAARVWIRQTEGRRAGSSGDAREGVSRRDSCLPGGVDGRRRPGQHVLVCCWRTAELLAHRHSFDVRAGDRLATTTVGRLPLHRALPAVVSSNHRIVVCRQVDPRSSLRCRQDHRLRSACRFRSARSTGGGMELRNRPCRGLHVFHRLCGAADVFVMPAPISSPGSGAQRRSRRLMPRGLILRRRHHGRAGRPTAICVKPDREGRGGREYGWLSFRQPGTTMTIPSVPAIDDLPAERNPAIVYLASLRAGEGRRSMASTLSQVAAMLGFSDAASCPWHELRHHHVAALRAVLAERYAPATANKSLAAIRGALRAAWRLDLIPTDAYHRAIDVPPVRGVRLPAGRSLEPDEIEALFSVCANGTPGGARDAAAFALLFGCGLRRAEAVAVVMADHDTETGAIRVIGKATASGSSMPRAVRRQPLDAWLVHRGVTVAGPILAPVSHVGVVHVGRGITPHSLMMRLRKRSEEAGIDSCSPHDLRRTFVSTALEAGADLAMVQALAGHASPATTAR